jgi:hypothetical protein
MNGPNIIMILSVLLLTGACVSFFLAGYNFVKMLTRMKREKGVISNFIPLIIFHPASHSAEGNMFRIRFIKYLCLSLILAGSFIGLSEIGIKSVGN